MQIDKAAAQQFAVLGLIQVVGIGACLFLVGVLRGEGAVRDEIGSLLLMGIGPAAISGAILWFVRHLRADSVWLRELERRECWRVKKFFESEAEYSGTTRSLALECVAPKLARGVSQKELFAALTKWRETLADDERPGDDFNGKFFALLLKSGACVRLMNTTDLRLAFTRAGFQVAQNHYGLEGGQRHGGKYAVNESLDAIDEAWVPDTD